MSDKKTISIKLAHFIRERRKELKMTQEQLAEKSGIDYKHIQNLENVRRVNDPKYSTLAKLAYGLDLHLLNVIDTFPKNTYVEQIAEKPEQLLLVSDSEEQK